MRRALDLAERGRGFVEPNPLVGAVVLRGDQMVGEGWHERFGETHAEVNALTNAGAAARGGTLYVTLEPCCHHGKTPPCTDAVLRSGVARVVAAMQDPFPEVAGQGTSLLRERGIQVEVGLEEAAARHLNAPYLKLLRTGRPYIHAKWAMTLDGKIATRTGDSKWISSPASRHRVHALRRRMDGIVVGIGTVLADDPLLTARPPGPRTVSRIILDSRGRLPLNSRLIQTAKEVPVILATAGLDECKRGELQAAGCEVLSLPSEGSRPLIPSLLDELGRLRMTNILVEGGSAVLGGFFDAEAVDEVHVFISPRIFGGGGGAIPVGGQGFANIAESLSLEAWEVERIDNDLLVQGVVKKK